MFTARLRGVNGQPDRLVAATEFAKSAFMALSADGLLTCPQCHARATHVIENTANGGLVTRSAHFMAHHAKGCDYTDPPPDNDHAKNPALATALLQNLPILININLKHSAYGFSRNFNLYARDTQTDLMTFERFKKNNPNGRFHKIPVNTVEEMRVLIDKIEKDYGTEKLNLLWFRTYNAVQSYSRFVVEDDPAQHGKILLNLARRAQIVFDTKKRRGTLTDTGMQTRIYDTPRLVRIAASDAQVTKAVRERLSRIFRTAVMAEMPKPRGADPVVQCASIGMVMDTKEDPTLTNQQVLSEGRTIWAFGSPWVSLQEGMNAMAVYNRTRATRLDAVYPKLTIRNRAQIFATGEKIKIETITTTPSRQKPASAPQRYVWQDRADLQ